MASKKNKKSSISDNKLLALASIALFLISTVFFFFVQTNKKIAEKISPKNSSQISQDKDGNVIDCSKKLTQKESTELEKMIAQGKTVPNDCVHMGCGNFF